MDSAYSTLESVNVDGTGRRSVTLGDVVGTGDVYGLAVFDGTAYISGWLSNVSIIEVQLSDRDAPTVFKYGLSTEAMFSNVYVSSSLQPPSSGATVS